ncbi:CehA/McbA family metallohydrolase [Anaerocolumna xylanovorans]|uniref:Ig-like domain (Group 2) n=1 Tax=Anaerocolumna xylanovorans DSM 12503 TaxID=1121345 RepID=A0A1M7Y0L4_9FIRM|nr:CehA/McbA family metallohydrolase [Anaerocolumna xylanovorans]SHO45193.1 Ig-like domain (group 2) [Anaerocolumna xylanovorans DSM 12503]
MLKKKVSLFTVFVLLFVTIFTPLQPMYTKAEEQTSIQTLAGVQDPIPPEAITGGAISVGDAYTVTGSSITVTGQVTACYGNKGSALNNLIIQDVINGEIVGLQVFDKNSAISYNPGDIISVTGTLKDYSGVRQLQDITASNVLSTSTPLAPQELTISQLKAGGDNYLSEYVLIKNVTLGDVTTTSGNTNTAISDATGTTVLYNAAPYPAGIQKGSTVDLYVVWSKFNTTYQLRNATSSDYVIASTDSGVDTSVVLPMASWSGSGPITTATVYADKAAANDQLNTNAVLTYKDGKIPQLSAANTKLGKTGAVAGDYYQIQLSSKLYGNIQFNCNLRSSGTGPKNFKVYYSTDGSAYKEGSSSLFSITKDGTVQGFSLTLPADANNADNLYIRLQVADTTSANGGTIGGSGTNYLSDIKITGSPVISSTIAACPTILPAEEKGSLGQEITITSKTAGAQIYYSFDDGSVNLYDSSNKPVFTKFPVKVTAYAAKAGLTDSLVISKNYSQLQVATVTASPNGGAKAIGTKVSLKCDTDGAKILYSTDGTNWKVYNDTDNITLTSFPVSIYAKAQKNGCLDSETSEFKYTQRLNEEYNVYFGQLHSHTDYSDGAGSCDQAFDYAKNTAKQIDFLAVTDHSNSFDNADKASIADGSVSSEWVEGHTLADKYTDSTFVGIYGFEMTWSNGLGHINTFDTNGFQSRTQTAYTTYSTALSNYYTTLKTQPQSISQFNHPGTTFGDFSDFDHYDVETDNLINMVEVGNGEGAIGSAGYFPSYEYYTRALDKGWHVAPTNNQDNHKGYWGDANTARTCILADSLTRDNIYDALRNLRIYATEDNDLSIQYTLNDEVMGTILDEKPKEANISVKLKDPTDAAIGKVEVIVNGGLSVAQQNVTTNEATVKFSLPADYSYYYIRVTEPDKNIAVTAPVWVGKVEAAGISNISTTATLPTKDEALDISTELYNNESKDLEIESMEYSIDNNVIHTVDLKTAGISKVSPYTKAAYQFSYTNPTAGTVNIRVTVKAKLDGVEKIYQNVLSLKYVDKSMITNVVIDGTHSNDYVTGYYADNMGNFSKIAADDNVKVTVVKDKMTAEILENCNLLIISAPAKKADKNYKVSHFEDEFINLVKSYTQQGKPLILCGIADYQDTADGQSSTEINKLLAAIGATTKINSDEAMDDNDNGGQNYRLYLSDFNSSAPENNGIVEGQKYSAYSGCTVLLNADSVKAGKADYLVKGHPTTYSTDSKKFDSEYTPIEKGNAIILAKETLDSGSKVYVSSTVFMSDFEVKAVVDNNWDLPYANKNIITNIMDSVKKQLPVSTVSDIRKGKMGDIYTAEGIVTAGTVTGNAFFDTIYIQDATGGINIFPINEGLIEVGQKVKVTGYLDQYLGDKELRVIAASVTDTAKKPLEPTVMTAKDAMDYETNGGKLVKVTGTITDVTLKNGVVETIKVKDSSEKEARIFVDGYITYSNTSSESLEKLAVVGNKISAVGLVSYDTEGERLRVRDRSEIQSVKDQTTGGTNTGTGQNSNNNTEIDKDKNAKVVTNVTKTTDSNGNTVTSTVKTSYSLTTGEVMGSEKEIVTGDSATGNKVTAKLTYDKNGKLSQANTVVEISNYKVSNTSGTATVKGSISWDALSAVVTEATSGGNSMLLTVNTFSDTILKQVNDASVKEVKLQLDIPENVLTAQPVQLDKIGVSADIFEAARKAGKSVSFEIGSGKNGYSWEFAGSDLSSSKEKSTDVNLSLQVKKIKEDKELMTNLAPYVNGSNNEGAVFEFHHSGILPSTAQVTAYVGDVEGLKPNKTVYIYYMKENTQAGSKISLESLVQTKVDENGYLKMPISHCSSYLVLTQKPNMTNADATGQITVAKTKVLYLGNTAYISPKVSTGAKAVYKYTSKNKNIATVSAKGKLTPKKAGTAVITTSVTIGGKTKTFTTKVTVKKPYIQLTAKKDELLVGESFTFKAKTYGIKGKITWSSNKKDVAEITKDGIIKAKKAGTVTITAKIKDITNKIKVKIVK